MRVPFSGTEDGWSCVSYLALWPQEPSGYSPERA